MEAPQIDVAYVAQLARLELTAEEQSAFQRQLSEVLAHAAQLGSLDLEGVEPTAHGGLQAQLREDVSVPGLTLEQALANAPAQSGGLFLTVRVVEES